MLWVGLATVAFMHSGNRGEERRDLYIGSSSNLRAGEGKD